MSGPGGPDVLDADAVAALLSPRDAVHAVEDALRAGLDPSATPPRAAVPTAHGELLLMPASGPDAVGVKVVSIAPGNARRGLPRVQGLYVLFDEETLTPTAVLDGAALTTLRTPAVSVAAVHGVLRQSRRPLRTVVFGAGPQGLGHLRTLADTLSIGSDSGPVLHATVVVRNAARAVLPRLDGVDARVVDAGSAAVDDVLAVADVVVCATTSRRPLFTAGAVPDTAVVVAVGAHELEAWEVEPSLAARARVVVEDVPTALREAGVVRAAVEAGHLAPRDLLSMDQVVTGAVEVPTARPLLFVSVGMAWEDLVVARRLHEAHRAAKR